MSDIKNTLLCLNSVMIKIVVGSLMLTMSYVIDLNKLKVVAKGPRNKGLYQLEIQKIAVNFSDKHVTASEAVWHNRLGHSNPRLLQQLSISKDIIINKSRTTPIYEPCQMGKSCRLKFFSSLSSVSKSLDRLHCDLWGPSPIVSNQGF